MNGIAVAGFSVDLNTLSRRIHNHIAVRRCCTTDGETRCSAFQPNAVERETTDGHTSGVGAQIVSGDLSAGDSVDIDPVCPMIDHVAIRHGGATDHHIVACDRNDSRIGDLFANNVVARAIEGPQKIPCDGDVVCARSQIDGVAREIANHHPADFAVVGGA